MTILPIVGRELRVAARRRGLHWRRVGLTLAALGIEAGVLVVCAGVRLQQIGQFIFQGLSGLLLLYALLCGRRLTADCLSAEKREGTLGLLFLTDLKGHDVVLGKLAATSLGGFYNLLAVFPVLAIPLLLGGVASGEFWRMVLLLMDTCWFSLALGILTSALSRDYRRAMAANFFLFLFLVAGLPATAAAMAYCSASTALNWRLFYTCPMYGFYVCLAGPYKLYAVHYWWTVAVLHGLTWLSLGLASALVPRAWKDKPTGAAKRGWGRFWRRLSFGRAAAQAPFRKRLLDVNAYYWLAGRARLKPAHVWLFLGAVVCWWLAGWAATGALWLDEATIVLTALILNPTFKLWLVLEAGHQLAEDRKAGTLELLLSTPLEVPDLLRGQWRALRRQFLGPLLAVTAAAIVVMLASFRRAHDSKVLVIWLAGIVMLGADLLALGWASMRAALTAKNQNQATMTVVLRLLVLPWLLLGLIAAIGNLWVAFGTDASWEPGWKFYVGCWFGLGLAADAWFGGLAWWQLHHRFRHLLEQSFNTAPERGQERGQERGHPCPPGHERLARGGLEDGLRQEGGAGEVRANKDIPAPASTPGYSSALSYLPAPRPIRVIRGPANTTVVTHPSAPPRSRRRMALAAAFLLVLAAGAWFYAKTRSSFPPPVTVRLGQTNAPLRVFAGSDGALFILPDGTLWRWGRTGVGGSTGALVPEQVGTNTDWVQLAVASTRCQGLRRDGTLWNWRVATGGFNNPPMPLAPGSNWAAIATADEHSAALRRDGTLWAWGDNMAGQFGTGLLGRTAADPVQVGTNHDWAAVQCDWNATVALRADGSLWTWGTLYSVWSGVPWSKAYPLPTQICRETNWAGFALDYWSRAWTRSGELWAPFFAPPNAEASIASTGRLLLSNALPHRVAIAFCGQLEIFQARPDGTLWRKPYPLPSAVAPPDPQWRRVGKRSDWVALESAGGIAYGLTADGTLWTWGVDPTRQSNPSLATRLKTIQWRVSGWFGPPQGRFGNPRLLAQFPSFQKEPRPLLRLARP